MRILFIGCVKSSYEILQELLAKNNHICGVITKKESTFNADFCNLSTLCHAENIAYHYSNSINDSESIAFINAKSPEIIYCIGWSELIKKEVLAIPPKGVVGFHPAAIPLNRGRHPIIWALALGLDKTASTFFMMDEFADSGDIIAQTPIKISITDDAASLYEKIIAVAKNQIIKITDDFKNDKIVRTKQISLPANSWRKRKKSDGKIDFRMSAKTIYDLVRALTKPYIGAHFEYDSEEYKVWSCQVIDDNENVYQNIEFGKVLEVYSGSSFLIKTGSGLLKIKECTTIDIQKGVYL